MASPVGKFTVRPQTATLIVSVTGDDPTCWTAQDGTATYTMPKTISANTDFWMVAGRYSLTITWNGATIESRTFEIQPGTGLTIDPDLDSFTEKASEFAKTLLAANNLSDLASPATALANLGAAASATSVPVTASVADDNKVHRQWQITSASRSPFVFSEWPSGPQTDTTYDHWVGFGFNAEVHAGTATGAVSTTADPALYMGFEDGWYDSNDSTDGSEWYVASWSPAFADGTRAVQLFRPFYTRIDRGTVATTVAAGSNGVDVATFAGAGTLNIASSTGLGFADRVSVVTTGGAAVIKYTGVTATTLTGCTTVSGTGTVATGGAVSGYKHRAATYCDVGSDFTGTFNVTRGPFAPIFVLSASSAANMQMTLTSTNETALVFQGAAGANKWTFKWNESAGFFQIIDNVNNRAHVKYTAGNSNTAATTEFGSNIKVDGNIGFFGTTPIAKRATTADATDLASVITLANTLKADLQAYGLKT